LEARLEAQPNISDSAVSFSAAKAEFDKVLDISVANAKTITNNSEAGIYRAKESAFRAQESAFRAEAEVYKLKQSASMAAQSTFEIL